MRNGKLTDEEIRRIADYFLSGEGTYVDCGDHFLGYHDIGGYEGFVTEISIESGRHVNITMFSESFGDYGMTPDEIAGYLRHEMEQVLQDVTFEKTVMEDKHLSVEFVWYEKQ